MTAYFENHNRHAGWLFSVSDLRSFYANCEISSLYLLRDYLLAIGFRRASAVVDAARVSDVALRQTVLELFDAGLLSRNVIGAEPSVLFCDIGFAAMKKSTARNYSVQRTFHLSYVPEKLFAAPVHDEITVLQRTIT